MGVGPTVGVIPSNGAWGETPVQNPDIYDQSTLQNKGQGGSNSGPYAPLSVTDMDRLRKRRLGHMNVGKAVVTLRHDDGTSSDAAVRALEQARGLVSTFGVPASVVGQSGKTTVSEMHTGLVNGFSYVPHSLTHPTTTEALFDGASEIVAARAALEALDPLIRGELWVTPGTVTGLFDDDADWNSTLGYLVRQTYIAGTGFSWSNQYWRSTQEFYGSSPVPLDTASVTPLATAKALVDEVVANKGVLHFSLHPWNLDSPGMMTTTNYTALLDYIKAYIDAGVLENLTVTGGLFATPWGDWEDIIQEGDFQGLPYTSATWGPWIATGTPTLRTDGGPDGPNYVRVNNANHISQSHYQVAQSDAEKAQFRFRCKIRNSGGATGNPDILLQDSTTPANWKVELTPTIADDGAWHVVSRAVTIPTGLDRVSVVLQSGGTGLFDFASVEMKRI